MQRQDVRRALLTALGRVLPRPSRAVGAGGPRRVLVIRPDHLGDMLFAVPALRLLREWLPHAHITALVGPWSADILQRSPYVDEVQTCAFPWFDRQPKGPAWRPYRILLGEAARLRREHYDLALILRFDHWWGALLAALAGVPERVGYAVPECRPFLTQAVPYAVGRHEVAQNLRLVAAACAQPVPDGGPEALPLEYPLHAEEEAAAGERLSVVNVQLHRTEAHRPRFYGVGAQCIAPPCSVPADHAGVLHQPPTTQQSSAGTLVALHVGAGAPVKLWPTDHFIRLGNALHDRYGAQIVLTGSTAEAGLVDEIAGGLAHEPVRVVGAALGEVAAVLRACRLVVGVDSGILHLAVAVGTPTVHLYGPVDPRTFGPWGPPARHRVVWTHMACAPCNRLDYSPAELPAHPCIRDITVERVLAAADAVLLAAPASSGQGYAYRH